MSTITILGAGVMGSAMCLPARDRGHAVTVPFAPGRTDATQDQTDVASLFLDNGYLTDVRTAVWAAAAYGVVVWMASRKLSVEGSAEIDFTPVTGPEQPEPAIAIDPQEGPVMVTIEYRIDPADSVAFVEVMDRTRRARLRQGALSWGLFKDTSQPGRYVEYFVDENWLEHQRRLERFTAFDAELREERLKFHQGSRAPVLRRYVAESGADLPPAL